MIYSWCFAASRGRAANFATRAVRPTERSTQQPEASYGSRVSTVHLIVQNVTDVGC